MRRGVITIEPEDSAAKAASMMANKKIGALPVTRAGKLAGIITATDILKAFAKHCKDI
jgi:acetoin utilization protein AcuB